jgi:hypothetical protein
MAFDELQIKQPVAEQAPVRAEPKVEPTVQLNFKSEELLIKFSQDAEASCSPRETETDHERQNRIALEEDAGATIEGHYTHRGQEHRKDKLDKLAHKTSCRAFAQAVGLNPIENFNLNLKSITLDDQSMVQISDNNVLMVRGDGPDSEFREATIEEKIQLETESQACSIASTQDELDMQAHLNGELDEIPTALRDLAEKHGHLAEDLTRDEFENLINEEYGASPHIGARMSAPLIENSPATSLLPPQPQMSLAPQPTM